MSGGSVRVGLVEYLVDPGEQLVEVDHPASRVPERHRLLLGGPSFPVGHQYVHGCPVRNPAARRINSASWHSSPAAAARAASTPAEASVYVIDLGPSVLVLTFRSGCVVLTVPGSIPFVAQCATCAHVASRNASSNSGSVGRPDGAAS